MHNRVYKNIDNEMIISFLGTIDLFTVAVHEFGHALGLVHSSELRSIMYPWYLHLPDRKALPIYDIRSIQGVYG